MKNKTIELSEETLNAIGVQTLQLYEKAENEAEKGFYLGIMTACATLIRDNDKPYIEMDYNYKKHKQNLEDVITSKKSDNQEEPEYHVLDCTAMDLDEILQILNKFDIKVSVKKKKDNDEE